MPKDETLPALAVSDRPRPVSLKQAVVRALGLDNQPERRRRATLTDLHEELFRVRGELALVRAELEH